MSMEVCPTQMPCVSTLTTPFLNVNISGRTSAAKLTGSCGKITDRNQKDELKRCPDSEDGSIYVYNTKLCIVVAYQEHHKTWCASPSRTCIRRIRTVRASLLSFLAPGDPYLQVSQQVQYLTWHMVTEIRRGDHIRIFSGFGEDQEPVKLTCVVMLRPTT